MAHIHTKALKLRSISYSLLNTAFRRSKRLRSLINLDNPNSQFKSDVRKRIRVAASLPHWPRKADLTAITTLIYRPHAEEEVVLRHALYRVTSNVPNEYRVS